MRLLHSRDLTFKDFPGSNIPRYAIVSHRWSETELSYQSFLTDKELYLSGHLESYGWTKIIKAAELTHQCNLEWIWIDTICINKESSAELTEAINSMYNWYKYACECFAFLPDVHYDEAWWMGDADPVRTFNADVDTSRVTGLDYSTKTKLPDLGHCTFQPVAYAPVRISEKEFMQSTWFKRSWTLQELMAPISLVFFNSNFQPIGTRNTLSFLITKATEIPLEFLRGDVTSRSQTTAACVAERMRWASNRDATRIEDKAYSMLGLFQVNLPLLYGEGHRAFRRLQMEIIKETNDESILAWMPNRAMIPDMTWPILSLETNMFSYVRAANCALFERKHYEVTNMGLRFTLPLYNPRENVQSCSRKDGVRKTLGHFRKTTLLFPLNCVGSCQPGDGKEMSIGLLALLVIINNWRSHRDLQILIGKRSKDLLVPDNSDANAIMPNAENRSAVMVPKHWISIATGERQSFDLVVDTVGGRVEDEYTLYLGLEADSGSPDEPGKTALEQLPEDRTRLDGGGTQI